MPGSATFNFTDPEKLRGGFVKARIDLVVMGPGVFRAPLTRVELKHLLLLSCSESLPRIAHVSLAPGVACVAFPTREAGPTILDGVNVQMGDILFLRPGQRFHTRTTGTFHWGCILFKPKELTRMSRAVMDSDLRRPECRWISTPARPLMRRLLRLHRQADQAALTAPDLIRNQGLAGELEHLLIEAAMACLVAKDERKICASHRSHADIMNRFQDMVQASPDGLLSLSELCATLGISGRTLRACCQQHLGMGPDRYLRLRRLNLARRALLRAVPTGSTVKEIFSRFGFQEPGRFAVVYRTLFGESPSVTLRRTPDGSQSLRPGDNRRSLAKSA
jgi:AraC-like DNA-binding protein